MSTLEGTVELVEGMTFSARSGSGHTLLLDSSSHGEASCGPSPMELLLLGLAGCTGMDVIGILRKMRQDVTDYRVHVQGIRADMHPRVFTTITVKHVIRGKNLNPDLVKRAIELSATRYCSASAMLARAARVEVRYRLLDEVSGEETTGALDGSPETETAAP